MKMRFVTTLVLVAPMLLSTLVADEARIPIFRPTLIAQAGHYIVTRDISVSGGVVITIGASNVTLDLNGRTISSSGGAEHLIQISEGVTNVTIRNGRLAGGNRGISYESAGNAPAHVWIEGVEISDTRGTGIWIYPSLHSLVRSCVVLNPGSGFPDESGIYVSGPSPGMGGRLVDNKVLIMNPNASGIVGGGDEVRGNVVTNTTTGSVQATWGIAVGGTGMRIEGNMVSGGGYGDAALFVTGTANLVLDNTVRPAMGNGITISGPDHRVSGNVVNVADGNGHGISAGPRTLLENNVSHGNTCGLSLGGASSTPAVYRNNNLSGNATAVCSPAGGFNAGGNVCGAVFCP